MAIEATFNYDELRQQLLAAHDDTELFKSIVDVPFSNPVPPALIFLGIVVFLQIDRTAGVIKRRALSNTDLAHATTIVSAKPFHEIDIPLDHYDNIIAHAIAAGEPSDTTDWKFLFDPAMSPEQARINQANAGIAYSAVYPLISRQGGALIFSYYQYQQQIGMKQLEFMRAYSDLIDEILTEKA